jgi:Tol biopolymer transport system component
MSLQPGTRLGAYEIVGPLGAGGMGEVYRAHDARLGRDVALKVLPELFAADPDRMTRFEREAKALASLNHPHIAQIYGIEEAPSTTSGRAAPLRAIVMELVEGPTLAEGGRLEVRDALRIAAQIADALDCAHEKGIVHRDLKPANIKVRDDGTVKVLDFGLAKAMGADGSGATVGPLADSPTFTTPRMTEMGMIIGTAAYMAPEQARGRPVDKRADIWAFGVVLFEMLAGRQLFAGETVSDTLAAVLREEIPWSALPPATPAIVRRVLERCLQKDPKRRLRDIGDARLEIEEAIAGHDVVAPPAAVSPAPGTSVRLPWIVAGVSLGALLVLIVWIARRAPGADAAAWGQFTQVTDTAGEETAPTLSPNGDTVVFASRARGTWDLYSQRVGGRNRTLIVGDDTRNELGPAFSPDGRQIAFHESDDDGGIFVAGATGESVRRLTTIGFHPAWSPDGAHIAFSTEEVSTPYSRSNESTLMVVDVAGGAPRLLERGDAVQPSWSPSGARIVFWSNDRGQRDLYTIPAAGGARVPLLVDPAVDWCPVWAPDGRSVIFASDRGGSMNLWSIPIDEASGKPGGPPVPLTNGVQAAAECASVGKAEGRLAFRSRVQSINPVGIPFDPVTLRAGVPVVLDSANRLLVPSAVSPDGRTLALFNIGAQQEDLFVSPTGSFTAHRVTDDPARDRGPVWLPDGKSMMFYSTRGGTWQLWAIDPDGGSLRRVLDRDNVVSPVISPAGDRLVFYSPPDAKVFIASLVNGTVAAASPQPLPGQHVKDGVLNLTDWSRDGRALTGSIIRTSGRSSGVVVYDVAGKSVRKVSDDSSDWVLWLPDNRRVVYITKGHALVVVDSVSGIRTEVDSRLPAAAPFSFAMAPDGRTLYLGVERSESDIWIVDRSQSNKR